MHIRKKLFAGLLPMLVAPAAIAQLELGGSLTDNCAEIDALYKAGKLTEARDKATLCLQGIEEALQGRVGQYFRTEIAGWKRVSYDEGVAMGFANITADYEKGDETVTVSLTRAGGAAGGFGQLISGFARAGMLGGGRQIRVGGLPATIQPDGTVTVPLEDGSFLTFSGSSFTDPDSAIAGMGDLIDAFPVAEINGAL